MHKFYSFWHKNTPTGNSQSFCCRLEICLHQSLHQISRDTIELSKWTWPFVCDRVALPSDSREVKSDTVSFSVDKKIQATATTSYLDNIFSNYCQRSHWILTSRNRHFFKCSWTNLSSDYLKLIICDHSTVSSPPPHLPVHLWFTTNVCKGGRWVGTPDQSSQMGRTVQGKLWVNSKTVWDYHGLIVCSHCSVPWIMTADFHADGKGHEKIWKIWKNKQILGGLSWKGLLL